MQLRARLLSYSSIHTETQIMANWQIPSHLHIFHSRPTQIAACALPGWLEPLENAVKGQNE